MTNPFSRVLNLAREVVAKRVGIVAGATVVLNLLIGFHVVAPEHHDGILQLVNAALDALGAVVAIGWARQGVTPVADPRAGDGTPLVRR